MATIRNEFGEQIDESDLVFTPADRARAAAELAQIPAIANLTRRLTPADVLNAELVARQVA